MPAESNIANTVLSNSITKQKNYHQAATAQARRAAAPSFASVSKSTTKAKS
jgi:hypothetical protein